MLKKSKKMSYDEMLTQHIKILKSLQYDSGLFAASSKSVATGYDKSWLRDNFYECLAFQVIGDYETVVKTYDALLKIFLKHEWKIDHAIKQRPFHKHEYIHARFHPETFEEFWEDWGNKQNDSIGAILFGLGVCFVEGHYSELKKNTNYIRIINKLVKYLESVKYFEDFDSGMWEEDEEIHASSVGACVAGLKSIKRIPGIEVSSDLIKKGEETLKKLLPRESKKKFVDLALLSLIYPYNVVTKKQRDLILENVEYHLLREKGVIRYKNDYYYNKNDDGYSEEAEWTFGLAWLGIIYELEGEHERAKKFLDQIAKVDTKLGMPELYYSNTSKYNENTPLGWSESMFIISLFEIHKKHSKKSKSPFSKVFYK